MKKFIFLFLLIILSFAFKNETVNSFPLFGKVISIDIGHGDEDPGSLYNDEYEKDYNLSFGKVLQKKLISLGADVIMTRDGDYDLSSPNASNRKRSDFNNRIKLIDDNNSDMYISLHMNYLSNSSYYGSQVFYSNINDDNKVIANILQDNLNKYFNFDKKSMKIGNDKYLYRNLKTKGVLIEFGFISSPKDRKNLKSEEYMYELSTIIADGIIEYFT